MALPHERTHFVRTNFIIWGEMQEKLSSPMAYMKNICAKIQTIWMWVILLEFTPMRSPVAVEWKKNETRTKQEEPRAKLESQKKAKQVTASLQWGDHWYIFWR